MNFVVMELKFIADVHLGKLASLLRMLGFDTAYQNNFTMDDSIKIGEEEDRVLLSKTSSLSKNNTIPYFIVTGEDPMVQLQQVVQHFKLKDKYNPFSRCMVCNGLLETVSKESIRPLIQNNTANYFEEFWQCLHCNRVYWKGSHFERINATIQRIVSMTG